MMTSPAGQDLVVPGVLAGIPVSVLIDTGSTITAVDWAWCESCAPALLAGLRQANTVRSASGDKLEVAGVTETTLVLDGKALVARVFVVRDLERTTKHVAILGLQAMGALGLRLECSPDVFKVQCTDRNPGTNEWLRTIVTIKEEAVVATADIELPPLATKCVLGKMIAKWPKSQALFFEPGLLPARVSAEQGVVQQLKLQCIPLFITNAGTRTAFITEDTILGQCHILDDGDVVRTLSEEEAATAMGDTEIADVAFDLGGTSFTLDSADFSGLSDEQRGEMMLMLRGFEDEANGFRVFARHKFDFSQTKSIVHRIDTVDDEPCASKPYP
ncbi:MAG TPA: retroviral-like aspartic protease, partial [Flavobacteriaceae bacterium]|nr:retroviral-like aspartic protease [Flavobacteriaceae bacterium]